MQLLLGSYRVSVERTPFTRDELIQRYDTLATEWQGLIHRLGFDQAYHHLWQQVLSLGYFDDLPHFGRVLDVGIGAADFSLALVDVLPMSIQIDGLDISLRMLERAEQVIRQAGIKGNYHQKDATSLPFEDQTFDLVMCAHTLEHLDVPFEGVTEMVRVAKPGANIVLVMTRRSLWGKWIQHRWRTHVAKAGTLQAWAINSGLQKIKIFSISGSGICRRSSLALIGRKP